jgi:hypothetical protein
VRGSKRLEVCDTVVEMIRSQGLVKVLEKDISEEKETKPQCLDQRLEEAWNWVWNVS